ncbi:MAG: aggregation factor core [Pseudomonadota bacterium]
MRSIAIGATAMMCATAANADISVRFIEGAPKDRFVITNDGACPVIGADIVIDLSGSASGLVFDVTSSGAGVEVFQPFELVSGKASVIGEPDVRDGQQAVTLSVSELAPTEQIAFTIDVDDTVGTREITVSGSEILGAKFSVTSATYEAEGKFNSGAVATALLNSCTS